MNITNFFEKSAPGRAMIEKWEKSAKQSAAAKRRETRTKLDRVEESLLAGVKQRRPGLQKRREGIADLEQQLRDERQALARDLAHDRSERYRHEVQCDLLGEELRETAEQAIAEFIENKHGELGRLQHYNIAHTQEPTGKVDLSTGRSIMVGFSEVMSLKRRIEAIHAAIESAQALQLEVGVDVGERLRALESGLPVIEMQELVT